MPPAIKKPIKKRKSSGSKKSSEGCYDHLDVASETALYYGFIPTKAPSVSPSDIKMARKLREDSKDRSSDSPLARFSLEEKLAFLRFAEEQKATHFSDTLMYYFDHTHKKTSDKQRHVSLEIIGADKSIAEAILIKTSISILKEEGFDNLFVRLNSMGDKDNGAKFARELTAYYRKNIDALPTHCKAIFKKNVFELLSCKNEKCRVLKEGAPKSVSFLSESARTHFKEVLEYLEILEIPYEIDHYLIDSKAFFCQTIFEIHSDESASECAPLATGVRYAHIAKKLGWRKDLPGIGAKLHFTENKPRKNLKYKKPEIYFIQLGFEAKLKSLQIVEILRQAKIPICQALTRDKLTSQLSMAENMKIPRAIIMGQKEAIEDSVIIRDMGNRSQETVKISELARYLKKL